MTNKEKLNEAKKLLEAAELFAGACYTLDSEDAWILLDYVTRTLKVLNDD